jgi:hypothetical protein
MFQRFLKIFQPTHLNPDWSKVIQTDSSIWNQALESSKSGPKILIATSTGGHNAVLPIESMLAVALTLRGAHVELLLCDRFLPACVQSVSSQVRSQEIFAREGPQTTLCNGCYSSGSQTYESLGLPLHRYSEWIRPEEIDQSRKLSQMKMGEMITYQLNGCSIGEHAHAGALRYFARGTLDGEPEGESIFRRYFQAALLTYHACQRLFQSSKYDCAVFHHGIYVPMGVIGETARKSGLRVANWNPAYRTGCFIFSHGDTYHHTLMTEPTSEWENLDLSPQLESRLMEYLNSRRRGTQDWIFFHEKPEEDLSEWARNEGIDFSKPTIGLLTNVIWDAQLHYPENIFPNMIDWVVKTIYHFSKRPNLQLIVRIHPAEIRGTVPSRQRMMDEIRSRIPDLSKHKNIFLISPDSRISTYSVMEKCNSVLIFGTKTGVELTAYGTPVVVAGEAWIRNKGITDDPADENEYCEFLDRLPRPKALSEEQIRRARKYAYHFFFRRMIPLSFTKKDPKLPYRLELETLQQLMPGHDKGLDVICEGILNQTSFIYPAERE